MIGRPAFGLEGCHLRGSADIALLCDVVGVEQCYSAILLVWQTGYQIIHCLSGYLIAMAVYLYQRAVWRQCQRGQFVTLA